jgi:hypothetical protein
MIRYGIAFVVGRVIVPALVLLSTRTTSAGELINTEAITLFGCDGF